MLRAAVFASLIMLLRVTAAGPNPPTWSARVSQYGGACRPGCNCGAGGGRPEDWKGSAQEHVRIADRAAADNTASARRERRRDERVRHEPEAQEGVRAQRLAAGATEGYVPEAAVEAAARISADARL